MIKQKTSHESAATQSAANQTFSLNITPAVTKRRNYEKEYKLVSNLMDEQERTCITMYDKKNQDAGMQITSPVDFNFDIPNKEFAAILLNYLNGGDVKGEQLIKYLEHESTPNLQRDIFKCLVKNGFNVIVKPFELLSGKYDDRIFATVYMARGKLMFNLKRTKTMVKMLEKNGIRY